MFPPQHRAKLAHRAARAAPGRLEHEVDVHVAHVSEHPLAKPAREVGAIGVQRHAIEVGAAHARPRVVHDEHLAVHEQLAHRERIARPRRAPEREQSHAWMIQQARVAQTAVLPAAIRRDVGILVEHHDDLEQRPLAEHPGDGADYRRRAEVLVLDVDEAARPPDAAEQLRQDFLVAARSAWQRAPRHRASDAHLPGMVRHRRRRLETDVRLTRRAHRGVVPQFREHAGERVHGGALHLERQVVQWPPRELARRPARVHRPMRAVVPVSVHEGRAEEQCVSLVHDHDLGMQELREATDPPHGDGLAARHRVELCPQRTRGVEQEALIEQHAHLHAALGGVHERRQQRALHSLTRGRSRRRHVRGKVRIEGQLRDPDGLLRLVHERQQGLARRRVVHQPGDPVACRTRRRGRLARHRDLAQQLNRHRHLGATTRQPRPPRPQR